MTFNTFTNLFLAVAMIICVIVFWYGAIIFAIIFIIYTLISLFRSGGQDEP